MLSTGDGIAIGCAILGGIVAILTIWSKWRSGNSKYVLEKACEANVTAMIRQIEGLTTIVTKGFEELRKNIRSVHERVDKIHNGKGS